VILRIVTPCSAVMALTAIIDAPQTLTRIDQESAAAVIEQTLRRENVWMA
tara:strand:+ start:945 stop:1094 length:150 start_codon:yes stop_codon:yes gene_type:complete